MSVTNAGEQDVFLRTVCPRIRGLVTRGHPRDMMGMVPHEIDSVVPLQVAPPGAPVAVVERDGTPAMFDKQEDLFVVGYDGAVWTTFVIDDGGWSTPIRLTQRGLAPPGAGIAAVRRHDRQIDVFVVGEEGTVWMLSTARDNDHRWGDWTGPIRVLPPRLAPAGANIAAVMRNGVQEDVFVVGAGGALWSTYQVNDRPWSAPIQLTPTSFAPAGTDVAAVRRSDLQLDVFAVDGTGAVSHTCTFFDPIANRWSGWQPPVQRLPSGCAPAGAHVAAVMRNAVQVDVFVVGNDGAICSAYQVDGSPWIGIQSPLTPTGLAPPGAAVVAMRRSDLQLDVFVVDGFGAINTTFSAWEAANNRWSGWHGPIQLTGPGFVPPGGHLAGAMRNPLWQDLSAIAYDGAFWTTFEFNNGAWLPPISLASLFGAPNFNGGIGLPTNMNTMEVASLYDRQGGGGVFFACLGGDLMAGESPLQFNLSATEVLAFWRADLRPGQVIELPRLAIGVHHTGDWHAAVDYYVARNQWSWRHPRPPTWFREAGAMYSFAGAGSGGIYMEFPSIAWGHDLKARIGSFRNLPQLLKEARELGTDVVYLWNYWEKANQGEPDYYANKGDYIPRSDMGSVADFKEGIAAVRSAGGKVILYVEPFIIYSHSNLGQTYGGRWDDTRNNPPFYGDRNFTMIAPRPWQDYMVAVALRLTHDYGADGIFLDSSGWQWNWPMQNSEMDHPCTPWEYSRGVLELADRVRDAIGPDRVVLCESTSGQLGQSVHGGLSSDLGQEVARQRWRNQSRILASPVRYGMPHVTFISNGLDMNELHQIYAAGHPLALCCNWHSNPDNPDYRGQDVFMHGEAERARIKHLLDVRTNLKDALVYGRQTYQPATGDDDVAAYFYEGTSRSVLTVVNTSTSTNYSGHLALRPSEANRLWYNALADPRISIPARSDGTGRLAMTVRAGDLSVYAMDR